MSNQVGVVAVVGNPGLNMDDQCEWTQEVFKELDDMCAQGLPENVIYCVDRKINSEGTSNGKKR